MGIPQEKGELLLIDLLLYKLLKVKAVYQQMALSA